MRAAVKATAQIAAAPLRASGKTTMRLDVVGDRAEALEAFMQTRKLLGVGWFAEVVGDAPLRGYVEVLAYKGSSVYDSRAMASLIDYLVDQAEQMELPIAYDLRQIERIKEDWGREFARRAAALEKGGN